MDHTNYIQKFLVESRESIESLQFLSNEEIGKAIDILFDAWIKGKHIFFMGNGGSAGNASHFAADLSKTTMHKEKKRFKAFCLNENPSLFTAWVNDFGWDYAYRGQLENVLEENDVIVILSVHGGSGWSGNLLKAAEFAKEKGAKIISFAGFDGGFLKTVSDACVIIPIDSTAHTEALHSVIQHLVIFRLKDLIENHNSPEVFIKANESLLSQKDPASFDSQGGKR